jgi:sugar phosphate isomerase/epimerase
MKLAISNIAWQDGHDCIYQLMQERGFTGLEIAPTKFCASPYDNLDIALQVKNSLTSEYGLSIVSMQSLLFNTVGLDLFGSIEKRQALSDYLKKAIIYAGTINCPVLVFGNPKNRIVKNKFTDYPIAIDFFQQLGSFAKLHNTCLCIEQNPIEYGANFVNSLKEANQLVNDVNSIGFKMIVDISTMLINKDQPEAALPVLGNVRHIHISMPFLKPLNQEYLHHQLWLDKFITLIKQSNYDKYVSIEMINAATEDVLQSLDILSQLAQL